MTHRDPVCGMTVDEEKAAGSTVYDGTHFYFCAKSCLAKFEADPKRYLQPAAARAPAPAASDNEHIEYTCPMDPDVVRLGPGVCPKCGMALEPVTISLDKAENPELTGMRRRFWTSVWMTAPLLAMMFLPHGRVQSWIEFALATPVVLWCGWPFFERGWASVVNRRLNMFTLIALGTGASYLFSIYGLLSHSDALYFEPASVITTLVLLGQVLELRARSRTSQALKALLGLTPKMARIVDPFFQEKDVLIAEIKKGDTLRVRPGEKVPADGVVTRGVSAVDESTITGEAVPVEKTTGSPVTAGTLNGSGSFLMRAERVGSETLLSQIVRMVGEAQRSRAPIQRLADAVAAWFVPAVVTAAILTFIAWRVWGPAPNVGLAFVNSVAVLIIACPCALGLATPMSVMVGVGRGAETGVLIRNAEALEVLQKATVLVVDKTGTLTEGKPKLSFVRALSISEEELLRFAGSLEQASEHPLASAIIGGAKDKGVSLVGVDQFESFAGKGVRGHISGSEVVLGNSALLDQFGIAYQAAADEAEGLRKQGQTVMFVAVNGTLSGLLGVMDPIKTSTAAALQALRRQGMRVVMLTGDNRTTALAVAQQLGIEEVESGLLPAQKAEAVQKLQASGYIVAAAGDGVNDAPALAQANVGIAMGTGTDVAMETAGVTLVKGDLRGIVRALRLSRATMRNIRQNLFFAFIYNVVGVPVAAGVLYPFFGILLSPMIASAAMTFSSVSVIGNALRLRRVPL